MEDVAYTLQPGHVYFVRDESGPIKIGHYTGELSVFRARLTSMQTGNARKLTCLATLAGTKSDEGALHRKFRQYRIRGEWFEPALGLLDYIREHAETYKKHVKSTQ